MSRRQPEIKIVYPEASAAALLLTEAMIRRSSGKRTVETESEEKEYNGEALFGGVLACNTSTGVELTLRLNPDAMDYALTTLIARNLTEDEKQAVRAATDSMEVDSLLSPAQAAEAAGGACTAEVGSACRAADEASTQSDEQKKQIEIEKVSERKLRDILNDMVERMEKGHGTFDAINHAVYEINKNGKSPIKMAESWAAQKIAAVLQAAGCGKKSKTLDPFARGLIAELEKINREDEYYISLSVLVALVKKMAETKSNDPFALYSVFGGEIEAGLSNDLDDVETEARQMRAPAPKQSAAPHADKEKTDEIEPGLLNDIKDGEEGEK